MSFKLKLSLLDALLVKRTVVHCEKFFLIVCLCDSGDGVVLINIDLVNKNCLNFS